MVTKPIMLDETGKRIATALETIAQNGGGGSSSGMYKHHIVMTCLNSCSSQNTLDVIFYTKSDTPLTEATFKAMFTLESNSDYKGLNVPYQYVNRSFTYIGPAQLSYDIENDSFYDGSFTYTFVSLTDTVE